MAESQMRLSSADLACMTYVFLVSIRMIENAYRLHTHTYHAYHAYRTPQAVSPPRMGGGEKKAEKWYFLVAVGADSDSDCSSRPLFIPLWPEKIKVNKRVQYLYLYFI
jgi:hypothetical protein